MWLALACLASLAPVVIGLESHQLTAGVALHTRELAGGELAIVPRGVPAAPTRFTRLQRRLAQTTSELDAADQQPRPRARAATSRWLSGDPQQ